MKASKLGAWFIGFGGLSLPLIELFVIPLFTDVVWYVFGSSLLVLWSFRLFCYATSLRSIIYGLALRKLPEQSVDPESYIGQFGRWFPSWMMEPYSHGFFITTLFYVPLLLMWLYVLVTEG